MQLTSQVLSGELHFNVEFRLYYKYGYTGNISIVIFLSEAHAKSRQFIAHLKQLGKGEQINIKIKTGVISYLDDSKSPKMKFGSTINQRKAIYYQYTDKIQDARIRADKKYKTNTISQKKKRNVYYEKQEKKIEKQLAKANKLTVKQYKEIWIEGSIADWLRAPDRDK